MTLPAGIHQPSGGIPDFGVILRLHVSDRFYATEVQVAAAATSDSTVPLTSTATLIVRKPGGATKVTHMLPSDGVARHYRARHVADGFTAGPYTTWVCAKPRGLAVDPDGGPVQDVGGGVGGGDPGDDPSGFEPPFWSEGRRRGDTFYSTDAQLKNAVRVTDGSGNFFLNRHNESGLAEHAEAVAFSADFESPPRITFVPQKAKVFSTSLGSDSPQFMDMAAESLTISGFTLRAVLNTSQASSANTDGWSTAQNATAPENGDVTLSADGDVAYCNLEDADVSAAANYRAFFQVSNTSNLGASLVLVELGFNSASTSTSFTVGDSQLFDANSTQEELAVNTALGADYDLRLRVSYDPVAPATSEQATVTAHGEDNAVPGVQWNKITGGSEETMTPSTGQKVLWQATETP